MGGNTTVFKYDNGGNLQYKKVYAYSAASGKTVNELLNGTTGKTISYGYGVATNKDLLTSYNGSGTLEYDNYGNPQKWFKHGTGNSALIYTLQWGNVSNLISIYDGVSGSTYNYKYNDQGIRTEKVVNGVTHKYYLQGEQIIAERYGSNLIKFYYDTTGVCGFNYNGTDYYYQKNIQGDILRIFNGNGTLCAEYSYDAWGKCTIKSNVSNIAAINPFRYRSYYFDSEIGLYYLNARYYDPEIGRFISPDSIEYINAEDINGLNFYAYCLNNPVISADPSGRLSFIILFAAAFIGFALSFIISVVSQAVFNNGQVNWVNALIDGAFGAVSSLLFMVPGLGPITTGIINAGLSFANGVITTSIDKGGLSELSTADWISLTISAAVSGVASGVARNDFFKAGGRKMLKNSHSQVSNITKRLSSGYYYKKRMGSKSVKSATKHIVKTVQKLNFGKGFWKDWLVSGLSSIFSNSLSRGLNGVLQ